MGLIARLGLSTQIKNAFGFRGDYSPQLDSGVFVTYDLARRDPLNDDLTQFFSIQIAQAAVAAQFSVAAVGPTQGRLIVDGLFVNPATAAAVLRFHKQNTTPVALSTAMWHVGAGNVGQFVAGFGATTQVADPLPAVVAARFEVAAAPASGVAASWKAGLRVGEFLIISPTAVNVGIDVTVWGRVIPNFPE